MAQIRYYFSSATITRTLAYPVNNGVFRLQKDREQIFYRENPANDYRFGGEQVLQSGSYNFLTLLDQEECEIVTLEMEVYCDGAWVPTWMGEFTWLDIKHDVDNCLIYVRPVTQDQYTCFMKLYNEVINPYNEAVVSVIPFITDEVLQIGGSASPSDCIVEGPYSGGDPALSYPSPRVDLNWCPFPESFYVVDQVTQFYKVTCYQRLLAPGTCDGVIEVPPTPDPEWQLLSGSCPGVPTYWRCPIGGSTFVTSPLPQGRDFNTVLELIFDACGLTVVSDFFGINPDATAPSNGAYDFAAANLRKMTLHQKSDVKRPYNSDPARPKMWEFKRSSMLEALAIMFNVYWTIDGTTVRIEHISYFDTSGGLDCTGVPMALEIESDVDDKIKEERFFWMDAEACIDYFAGSPIVYDCGTEILERRVSIISTDISIINDNDSTDILDEGFVLIATDDSTGERRIIRDNQPLSFSELHSALHRWYRYFKDFTLNGAPTTALSTRGTKRQIPFTARLCCDDAFDPSKLVETPYGFGRIQSGERDYANDTVRLELKY